jgi:hypothetical protein
MRLPRRRISPVFLAILRDVLPFLDAITKYSRKVADIANHSFEFAAVSLVFKQLVLTVAVNGQRTKQRLGFQL